MDFNKFPSTRYQGSKRKILPWIYNCIKDISFNTVLDAFGGSASVSYLFKKMDKEVTYNDLLQFNYFTGVALIENNNIKITNEDLHTILNYDTEKEYLNFIQKTFKDFYYYDDENIWLDRTVFNILNMNHYNEDILKYKKAIIYHAIFQACLMKRPFNLFHRKNLYLRKNNVKRTFGNFTSWEKTFPELFNSFIFETNNAIFDNNKKCKAINESVFDIKESNFDLVYFDPPYFKKYGTNETSNYRRIYHFLEGIARYNEWENLIDYDTINLRFKKGEGDDIELSNSCQQLESLINKFRKSKIIISYKKGGTPAIETIVKILKKYKNTVYTKSIQYSYALNHQNGDARKNREVLIFGL